MFQHIKITILSALIGATVAHASTELSGNIKIDGSSTVGPISEAMAEEFGKLNPKVRVTVGISGTGGGFKKFTAGEIDISDASRTIKPEEQKMAEQNKIKYVELPIAYDGITVVVNKENTWAKTITVAELKKIWEPNSTVKKWNDVRKDWPDKAIKLYGPGTDSGTFDYFTEEVNGKAKASRSDFTMSEDDNILVAGVEGDKYAMGYFGYAYYTAHQKRLTAVAIDSGKGAVAPNEKTIVDGSYKPLSRKIYIYVSHAAAKRPEVKGFVDFYIGGKDSAKIIKEVGYLPLNGKDVAAAKAALGKFHALK